MKIFRLILFASLSAIMMPFLQSCGSSSSWTDNVDLIPVLTSKDGKWSMIDPRGEIVYDSEFKNCPTVAYNGLFSVEEGKGYSVYKIGGKSPELVNRLENLKSVGILEDGLMPVTFPGKRISMVDQKGETKFELNPVDGVEIINCAPNFQDGLLVFETADNKCGYIDTNGEIAIKPKFDFAYSFSEGLAVVGKYSESKEEKPIYRVIDKKGDEVFRLNAEFNLKTTTFIHDLLIAERDDRCYLIDRQGNETKLPSKIHRISDFDGTYIIFSDEDDEEGIADMNGDILVRPKYHSIMFGNNGDFLAKKNDGDKTMIRINAQGDEIGEEIDYEYIYNLWKFGYIAKEGDSYVMLDDDFKTKNKTEFNNWNFIVTHGAVYSDYFDAAEAATKMVKMIDGNKVGSLTLGDHPSQIFKNENPKDYTFSTHTNFDDLDHSGFRYKISVSGTFTESISDYEYNYDYYDYNYNTRYFWNPSSKLYYIQINVSSECEWGKLGQDELVKAIKAAGYTPIKEGKTPDHYAAAFKKGGTMVIATSEFNGNNAKVTVFDCSDGNEPYFILSQIVPLDGTESSSDPQNDYFDTDSTAADTIAVVVEDYDYAMADTLSADYY